MSDTPDLASIKRRAEAAPDKLELLLPCHECNGTGLIGRMVGARHVCNLCDGEGKFADRRRPAPSPEAGEVMRLAEAWVEATDDWHYEERSVKDATMRVAEAENALRSYVTTMIASKGEHRP